MPLRTFVINSSHYVAGSNNIFRFPLISNPDLTGCKIGVQTASVYNSTFNIVNFWGNNQISVAFPANATATTYTTYNFTFPDSYMSISDMNYFIQSQCIANGLYAINSQNQYVYFIELVVNSVQYAGQLNIYPIPNVATATANGWTSASVKLIFQTTTPVLPSATFAQPFGNLIGLNAGKYGGVAGSSALNILQPQNIPNINPVNSYVLVCNLLNNPYCVPNNIFYTIPLNGPLGSLISISSADPVFNDIAPNKYDYIQITLYDQNLNPLMMKDKEMTLTLALMDNRVPINLRGTGLTQ